MSVSTVQSISKDYLEEIRKRRTENETEIVALLLKKRGRPVLLGQSLLYLQRVREGGAGVSGRIAMAATRAFCSSVIVRC